MNYIWFLLIVISIVIAAFTGRLSFVVDAIVNGAEQAVKIAIYLIGIMAFWLGMMKIAEKSGLVDFIAKLLKPIAKKLFPEIADDEGAIGAIAMNISANALGLSNAATPMGINAMEKMQKHNIDKSSASNSMCTFLAMNTAGFQLVPATVIAVLAANNVPNPTQIIAPTLLVTTLAFCFAIIMVKALEKVFPPQVETSEVAEDV